MQISFKIRYANGTEKFNGLDMYYGAKSLQGISEILMLSFHGLINEEVIVQAPSAKGFQIILKKANEGSYEQFLQLFISDPTIIQYVTDLGKSAIYDFLKYLISSCLGIPFIINNRKAKKKIQTLMQQNDDLNERLTSALRAAHAPVKSQGLSVTIHLSQTAIVTFDQETLDYLDYEIEDSTEIIESLCVSRFNVRTGTGRFIQEMNGISYGFSPAYDLSPQDKQLMVDNLRKVAEDKFEPLNVVVKRILTKNGQLKRYRLHGASNA